MLLGAIDENGSLLQSASFAFGCLARPLNQQRLTHAGIIQVKAFLQLSCCDIIVQSQTQLAALRFHAYIMAGPDAMKHKMP